MGKMRAFLLAAILLVTIVIAHQGPAGLSASSVTGVAQPPAPFTGYADLPGVRLWYSDTGGSGTPLVLLHANTGNADSWTPNIPGLAAAGYRLIAFDRRGWGRSVADPDTARSLAPSPATSTRSPITWGSTGSISLASRAAGSPRRT